MQTVARTTARQACKTQARHLNCASRPTATAEYAPLSSLPPPPVSRSPRSRRTAPRRSRNDTTILRSYASISSQPPASRLAGSVGRGGSGGRSGVKVGTLFLALSIVGLGATSVGLYSYYSSFKTFPPEIRSELRSALRCKVRNDYVYSDQFFAKAWTKALELQDQLGLLKVTGIAISWAEMLEEAARRADAGNLEDPLDKAYGVILDAYDWARMQLIESGASSKEGFEPERMRTVSMAVKLAGMAENQKELETQSEEQLTYAVEELLRLTNAGQAKSSKTGDEAVLMSELSLPPWVTKTDVGATLEMLGNLYAKKGNVEYAMPLYLQSISLLLPPPGSTKGEPSIGDKCHAATIMNNLSSLIASAPSAPSKEISQTTQAIAWANKASAIASAALAHPSSVNAPDQEVNSCKPVITVALYNLGMLKLMEGKKEDAKALLNQAKERGKEWKMKDAELRASEVLKSM